MASKICIHADGDMSACGVFGTVLRLVLSLKVVTLLNQNDLWVYSMSAVYDYLVPTIVSGVFGDYKNDKPGYETYSTWIPYVKYSPASIWHGFKD